MMTPSRPPLARLLVADVQELVGEVSEIPGLPPGDCQAYVQAV